MKSARKTQSSPRRKLVREEILARAAEVFERKGYGQATIQDVAQALELSRSALYHYFKSKDEILEALVAEHTEQAAEQMERHIAKRSGPAIEQLRDLLSYSINSRLAGGA